MILRQKATILVGTFLLISAFGVLLGLSTPYSADGDEHVYLLSQLSRDSDLPDSYMLQGINQDPYLYPRVFGALYDPVHHDMFKSISLIILLLSSGLAAFYMFSRLGLVFVPALIISVIALMPRFSIGLETFGIITFREAIGRSYALPLFFVASAFLIMRTARKKPLWPIFAFIGFFIFIHPITVVLFGLISLFTASMVMFMQRYNLTYIIKTITTSFVAFLTAGSYFFVEVLSRLSNSVEEGMVSIPQYVAAVMYRNTWEFPAASVDWLPHMFIVSVFFIVVIGVSQTVLQHQEKIPHTSTLYLWGITMALSAVILSIAVPAINLLYMENHGVSYIFQEWNRIAKFYYLGLFIALIPAVNTLWYWYKETTHKLKHICVSILVLTGIASSSFGFEWFQFVVGYKNVTEAYIPQILTGAQDGISPEEYKEICSRLTALGAIKESEIVSKDFNLRYYCQANLHVTFEEGSAYMFLSRSDLVNWHDEYLRQRVALKSSDPYSLITHARSVGASFVVDGSRTKYSNLKSTESLTIATTSRRTIMRIND